MTIIYWADLRQNNGESGGKLAQSPLCFVLSFIFAG